MRLNDWKYWSEYHTQSTFIGSEWVKEGYTLSVRKQSCQLIEKTGEHFQASESCFSACVAQPYERLFPIDVHLEPKFDRRRSWVQSPPRVSFLTPASVSPPELSSRSWREKTFIPFYGIHTLSPSACYHTISSPPTSQVTNGQKEQVVHLPSIGKETTILNLTKVCALRIRSKPVLSASQSKSGSIHRNKRNSWFWNLEFKI